MGNLPKVALGTWSWGVGNNGGDKVFGNHLGINELKPVFEEAMKYDLNLWDSAAVYGMGASENILAAFIKEYNRKGIIISTKFTPAIAGGGQDPVAAMCAGSLKRFHTDYIDLYWIHSPADIEKWTPLLVPLVKSGKVKHVGVSNHNLAQIKRAEEILSKEGVHLSAVQNHYSLLYRSSEDAGILDYCSENNLTFFSYMVLEQGVLNGKYNVENPLPADSHRGKTYNPIMPQIENLTAVMKQIADKYQAKVAQIPIAWAIQKGTLPILGVTKVEQVQDVAEVTKIQLSEDDMNQLEKIGREVNVDTKGFWENAMI